MGLISPLGNSIDALWEVVSRGGSGVDIIKRLPTAPLPSDVGGEATDFKGQIGDFGELDKMTKRAVKKGLRLMCREIQMGVAAAQLALGHAGLNSEAVDPARIGTIFGSDYIITEPAEFAAGVRQCMDADGKFDFTKWGGEGRPNVEPLWLLKYLPNMPASHVAIYNDFRGPSNSLTVREASSNLAVAEATTTIRRGCADAIVAGATGSRLQTLRTIHVSLQEQLADRQAAPANGDPEKACRPYELDRTGMVLGEGAGAIILEELESAKRRGATIYGEVVGYGSSVVSDKHGVADYKKSIGNSLRSVLRNGKLDKQEIGHVHGHGIGDDRCDREEAAAIEELFGSDMPVTASKSMMGNLGAGSGVVELISSLVGLGHGKIVPTINHEHADPECPIEVVSELRDSSNPTFINVNVTPYGQSSAVAIRASA
jgi:3-oxoacyl-[acyl-carrier-protein] synthase II